MLTGLNEQLEMMLGKYSDCESGVEKTDVLDSIAKSVAAGDLWHIPVDAMGEDMNDSDYPEGIVLEKLPAFIKRTLGTNDNNRLFCAFTSADKVHAEGAGLPTVSVPYPAGDFIKEFLASEVCDGLMLNPWSDSFLLSREQARQILDCSKRIPEREVSALRSYIINPRAVIDSNEILDSWKEGWAGNDKAEEWRLIAYPIMADGRILLLFEMRDEIHAGNYDTFHVESTFSHYRVLEYAMKEDTLRLINKYRFMAQNADVATVYLYDGELWAVISGNGGNTYSALPMIPTNDDRQIKVFGNVNRFASNSSGDLIVAYKYNQHDKYRIPLLVFDKNGETIDRVHDEYALKCADINLDKEENIWYHLFPSSTICMLGKDESCAVALSGWDCFAFSSDRSKLFLSFDGDGYESAQYILTKDNLGNYSSPIRFTFQPTNDKGEVMKTDDCDVFGICSSMKSWVLLNAGGRLFLYDVDDCVE